MSLRLAAISGLPEHCSPTYPLFTLVSGFLHSCIPTPLAFASVLLGSLSIVSWLCAQLPQVVKNFRLHSTSGLSFTFLFVWCLGDMSNLIGCVLTGQALWQIIVASYYCFIDLVLVGQWIWYERLRHGMPLRRILYSRFRRYEEDGDGLPRQAAESTSLMHQRHSSQSWNVPEYSKSRKNHSEPIDARSNTRKVRRAQLSGLPSPSPRTILFVSLLIALTSVSASPVHLHDDMSANTTAFAVGTFFSWASTFLYLVSRLPQLVKNYRSRSTAGLSPIMFFAAFCGNAFYSASLMTNPQGWHSYPAYGGHGWVREDPSKMSEWIAKTLPFWLGAAGVLALDASVGVQFWLYGARHEIRGDEEVLVVRRQKADSNPSMDQPTSWRRVSGWMRGWQPDLTADAVAASPGVSVDWGQREVQSQQRTEQPNPERESNDEQRQGYGTI